MKKEIQIFKIPPRRNIKGMLRGILNIDEIIEKLVNDGDDFYFLLGDKNLSLYGSQGQIRSAVLALKLSEVKLFNNITGDTPILLLDDMFSELDINKRNNILKYLDRNIQTIITTTDIKNINEKIKEKANVYEIKEGKIISREIISKQEGD